MKSQPVELTVVFLIECFELLVDLVETRCRISAEFADDEGEGDPVAGRQADLGRQRQRCWFGALGPDGDHFDSVLHSFADGLIETVQVIRLADRSATLQPVEAIENRLLDLRRPRPQTLGQL